MDVVVIVITDGQAIEYPPEIYLDRGQAEREAEHWAWTLSGGGEFEVRRPFNGRWEVGIRDIRLVSVAAEEFDVTNEWWVGLHWTKDGFPEPDGVLLSDRTAALEWITQPPSGRVASSVHQDDWLVSATFAERGEESQSVALRAKVIATVATSHSVGLVDYELELVGTFVQSIRGSVQGPSGLGREQIEELVDRDWSTLSIGTEVLLESSWELESFTEMPR